MLAANTDCRGYGYISIVTTSVGSGLAWTGQFAPNSGGTYISGGSWQDDTSATGLPGALGTSVNKIYNSTVVSDFFQLNVTALTSGTLSGYIILSSLPRPYHGLTINTNSATGSAVPANAFFMGIQNGSGNLQGISSANNTGDASSAVAVVSAAEVVYNGSTFDRLRGAAGAVAAGTGTLATSLAPTTAQLGLTIFSNTAVLATAVAVKASAGRLNWYNAYNPNASVTYLQIFNVASGSVTVGTTAPTISVGIPANSGWDGESLMSLNWSTAISIAATTTPTGSTAPGTGIVVNFGVI